MDTVIREAEHPEVSNEILYEGCDDLAKRVKELSNLKIHLFGHLHLNQSQNVKINNTTFYNVAICNEQYKPVGLPTIINL